MKQFIKSLHEGRVFAVFHTAKRFSLYDLDYEGYARQVLKPLKLAGISLDNKGRVIVIGGGMDPIDDFKINIADDVGIEWNKIKIGVVR